MKTNAERCKEWRAKNRERVRAYQAGYKVSHPEKIKAYRERWLHSEKGQASQKKMHNKQKGEAIKAKALQMFTPNSKVVESRNNEILNLYKRGKSPADIVIRLHIPMSRVMAVIQNA